MSSKLFGNDEVSMLDVLEEDKELEEEANAVFGDSDDQNCTYEKGYMKRQALYACLTCTPVAPNCDPAGICLACSLSCHDGHELVELYTKRNFRCDCGNDKFPDFECKLEKRKDALNALNTYNQNFKGLYCTCHRPYPDPDDEIEDEMIQCVSCEDWFHSRHLGNLPPMDGEYSEMICDKCMERIDLLQAYRRYSLPSQEICTIKMADTHEHVNVERCKSELGHELNTDTNISNLKTGADIAEKETLQPVEKALKRKPEDNMSQNGETSSKKFCENGSSGDDKKEGCVYEKLSKSLESKHGCSYWKNGWRSKLCVCEKCKLMYKQKGIEFLLEESDTIIAYEERGRSHREQQSNAYDSSLDALNNLGRVQQIEILHGYNDMKTQLTSYLAGFAREGKIVTKEDIQSFFQQLRDKKSKDSIMPHYCR